MAWFHMAGSRKMIPPSEKNTRDYDRKKAGHNPETAHQLRRGASYEIELCQPRRF